MAIKVVDHLSSLSISSFSQKNIQRILRDWAAEDPKTLPIGESRERALELISDYLKNPTSMLSVNGLFLSSLPDIFDAEPFVEDLEFIRLNSNHLKELPPSFFAMKNLKAIWIHDNYLEGFQSSFSNFPDLVVFCVSNNRLSEIPDLSMCKSLEDIWFHENLGLKLNSRFLPAALQTITLHSTCVDPSAIADISELASVQVITLSEDKKELAQTLKEKRSDIDFKLEQAPSGRPIPKIGFADTVYKPWGGGWFVPTASIHGSAIFLKDDEILSIERVVKKSLIPSTAHYIDHLASGRCVIQQGATRACSAAVSAMLIYDRTQKIELIDVKEFFDRNLGNKSDIASDLKKAKLRSFCFPASSDLSYLKTRITENGSLILEVSDEQSGGHYIILDEIDETLEFAKIRDPYHGWGAQIKCDSLIKRVDHQSYLIGVKPI
jgi:hypothetical protein